MSYAEPVAADLQMRYPAFAAVDPATITYWLTDAHRFVDTGWSEGDYAPALIAAAAHGMAQAGTPGISNDEAADLAASGVTDFQSGAFRLRFSDDAVKAALATGFGSTIYGREYLALLATNRPGFGTSAPGAVCCDTGFNGFAGPLGYPAVLFGC